MKVHAIYEDGKLTFQQPVHLKVQRIELEIEIPDNYIEEELQAAPVPIQASVEEQKAAMQRISPTRESLDAILGKWRHHGGLSGASDYKALWHEHLEEKHLGKR